MELTKMRYIATYPDTTLSRVLSLNNWPDTTVIKVVESVIKPHNKNCNLGWYMHLSELRDFVVGKRVGRVSDNRYIVAIAMREKM